MSNNTITSTCAFLRISHLICKHFRLPPEQLLDLFLQFKETQKLQTFLQNRKKQNKTLKLLFFLFKKIFNLNFNNDIYHFCQTPQDFAKLLRICQTLPDSVRLCQTIKNFLKFSQILVDSIWLFRRPLVNSKMWVQA